MPHKKRILSGAAALREAIDQSMAKDPSVFVVGEGVPDPKGIFGTTIGLQEKYGKNRVWDMPVSENGMTGACIGAALAGIGNTGTGIAKFSAMTCRGINKRIAMKKLNLTFQI